MKMRETAAATATQKPPRAKPGGGYDDADDHIAIIPMDLIQTLLL